MTTAAVIGAGAKIYNTTNSPEVAFGEVTGISGLGATRPEVEATHLDSTGVERIGGLQDGNEITITGNYVRDSEVDGFVTDVAATQVPTRTYRIEVPTSPRRTYSFTGIPLSWSIDDLNPSGVVTFSLGLRISGSVTVA